MTIKIPNGLQLNLARAVLLALVLLLRSGVQAQTAAFSYQGKLFDNGNSATDSYDFQFKVWFEV